MPDLHSKRRAVAVIRHRRHSVREGLSLFARSRSSAVSGAPLRLRRSQCSAQVDRSFRAAARCRRGWSLCVTGISSSPSSRSGDSSMHTSARCHAIGLRPVPVTGVAPVRRGRCLRSGTARDSWAGRNADTAIGDPGARHDRSPGGATAGAACARPCWPRRCRRRRWRARRRAVPRAKASKPTD